MTAHCFHLTPYYGLPCSQLVPRAVTGTHWEFSPRHRDRNICTDLLAHALRLDQQGPSFLSLTAQCICLSAAFQGSCWSSRWRAAALNKLSGYSLRHWRDPQASGGALPLSQWKGAFIAFFSTGKKLNAAQEIHSERALDGIEKTLVRFFSIMVKLFLMDAALAVTFCSC